MKRLSRFVLHGGQVRWRRLQGVRWARLGLTIGCGLGLVCGAMPVAQGAGVATGPGVFFVALDGNDQWSGQLAAPNGNRTDGPFATLARARDAVRQLKAQQGGALRQPVTVYIRGGLYSLTEPLVFGPEDSGSAQTPVTYAAYPDETPVISGGRRITGWQPGTVQGRSVWTVTLPDVKAGRWYFRQLWVNGQRRTRARHPNKGYLAVEAIPDTKPDAAWTEGQIQFRFKPGDLQAWPTVDQAEVRVMNRWVESHLPVVAVDEAQRLVRFSKRTVFKLDPGDLYYIEGALELLDQPGEWFLDRPTGTLYYLPMPGEEMQQAEVIAPVLAQLVLLEGQPEANRCIEHLVFRGLSFAHTEWYFPGGFDTGKDKAQVWPPPKAEVGGFAQAAVGVPGAVRGHGLRACRFERCNFVHLGGYGLELARGCHSNVVSRCQLSDLGAGGIKLGETAIRDRDAEVTRHNEVRDCHIFDGGRLFHSAIGIWIGQSPGNRLLHNHIHDFYYTGISVGWTWGYGRALATNTLVAWNHVHHIGVRSDGDGPILSDMGGIYTLGLHAGTQVRSNLWHDCAGLRYGGWGIYFDEGTTGLHCEDNIVYRTTHGGFHQHYGRDNVVRNNIFAFGQHWQIQRSRAEAHRSFIFERNIVYWDRGRLLDGNFSGSTTNYLFDSNLYWRVGGGDIQFASATFAQWQQRGQDVHSMIADPLFRDPARGDFSLGPESPALKLGFRPIDLRGVGVRPEPSPSP